MAAGNLHERLACLERVAEAKDHTKFDEDAFDVCLTQLKSLQNRRSGLLEARKPLPLEHRLALARQDRDARAACEDVSVSEPLYRWGRELAVRSLEIEILKRDALVGADVLDKLTEGRGKLLVPFVPLPVEINVMPVPDEEMRQIEREIDECAARLREIRAVP